MLNEEHAKEHEALRSWRTLVFGTYSSDTAKGQNTSESYKAALINHLRRHHAMRPSHVRYNSILVLQSQHDHYHATQTSECPAEETPPPTVSRHQNHSDWLEASEAVSRNLGT